MNENERKGENKKKKQEIFILSTQTLGLQSTLKKLCFACLKQVESTFSHQEIRETQKGTIYHSLLTRLQ